MRLLRETTSEALLIDEPREVRERASERVAKRVRDSEP